MENFERFEILLVPFPFTDRSMTKRRPALVLSGEAFFQDTGQVICAMITTAKRSRWQSDVILTGWLDAGLPVPSKVRMKIFTLDGRMVIKKLGCLSEPDVDAVARSFQTVFA